MVWWLLSTSGTRFGGTYVYCQKEMIHWCDVTHKHRKPIIKHSILLSCLVDRYIGMSYMSVYIYFFSVPVLVRAWHPTLQVLLKATDVRTLLWALHMVAQAQRSTSEPLQTHPRVKLRNCRNLVTACKLLSLVSDSQPALDRLSHPIQQSLRHWDWCLHLRGKIKQASQPQF